MVGVKYKRADKTEERGRQTNKIMKCKMLAMQHRALRYSLRA